MNSQNNTYYSKYLKYKNKYLELKKLQIGGQFYPPKDGEASHAVEGDELDEICPICLQNFENGDVEDICKLYPCGHKFHNLSCFLNIPINSENSKNCPICRTPAAKIFTINKVSKEWVILAPVRAPVRASVRAPVQAPGLSQSGLTFDQYKERLDNNIPITPLDCPQHTGEEFLELTRYNHPLQPGVFPSSLKTLKFRSFNQRLVPGVFPDRLEELSLGQSFNQPLEPGVFPAALKYLSLGQSFNQPLEPGVFPAALRYLILADNFNKPLVAGVIPPSVRELDLGLYFNQELLPGVIPYGVQKLTLSWAYNHPLVPGVIPDSVSELIIGHRFEQVIPANAIPASVRRIIKYTTHNQNNPPRFIHGPLQQIRDERRPGLDVLIQTNLALAHMGSHPLDP